MKDERKEIEVDDGMEAAGKVVEKRGKITLLRDGLADFEQGFELTPGVFERGGKRHFRRRNDGVRHRRQDNTRVGEGSTGGNRVSWLVSGNTTYQDLAAWSDDKKPTNRELSRGGSNGTAEHAASTDSLSRGQAVSGQFK